MLGRLWLGEGQRLCSQRKSEEESEVELSALNMRSEYVGMLYFWNV